MGWTLDTPPTWCENAIATDRGWLNPETKTLEVSCKYLNNSKSYNQVLKLLKENKKIRKNIKKLYHYVTDFNEHFHSKILPKKYTKIAVKKTNPERPSLSKLVFSLMDGDENLTGSQVKNKLNEWYPDETFKLTTINMYLTKWRKKHGKTKSVGKPKLTENDENFNPIDLLDKVT